MVQIVTDSSVLYTEEEAKAAGFDVIPLCVSVGDLMAGIYRSIWKSSTGVLERERSPGLPASHRGCCGGL